MDHHHPDLIALSKTGPSKAKNPVTDRPERWEIPIDTPHIHAEPTPRSRNLPQAPLSSPPFSRTQLAEIFAPAAQNTRKLALIFYERARNMHFIRSCAMVFAAYAASSKQLRASRVVFAPARRQKTRRRLETCIRVLRDIQKRAPKNLEHLRSR
jgi:hypothetical protein